jgi:RNA polymerase sigma-70 factor, ECF subfamily
LARPPGERTATVTEDDARLVALARSGHADAFEQLVRRHQISAYRVALRLLGDPGEAEDAVQDAFLQVWRNLKRFRSSSSFATWLYRIVTNRCLNLLRSRRWSAQLVEDHTLTAQADPAEIAEARGKLAVLKVALLRLTPEQRAAFVLRHLEGCSHEQIAHVLDISVPAVKSRLHRARAELLAVMDEWA